MSQPIISPKELQVRFYAVLRKILLKKAWKSKHPTVNKHLYIFLVNISTVPCGICDIVNLSKHCNIAASYNEIYDGNLSLSYNK